LNKRIDRNKGHGKQKQKQKYTCEAIRKANSVNALQTAFTEAPEDIQS
jgi:hypothetical protein